MNKSTYLLVKLFQSAVLIDPDIGKTEKKYVSNHRHEIKATCRVLERLGLVEQDEQSVVGYQPTRRLLKYLAERSTQRSKLSNRPETNTDRALFDLLMDVAGIEHGWRNEPTAEVMFAGAVLNALELFHDDEGALKATPMLRRLIAEHDFRRDGFSEKRIRSLTA
jgi:hypothetical protein